MLLALAARSSALEPAQEAGSEGSATASGARGPLTAWTAERRRRRILSLENGESLALEGEEAGNVLMWWCAQLLARDEVRLTELDNPRDGREEDRFSTHARGAHGVRLT